MKKTLQSGRMLLVFMIGWASTAFAGSSTADSVWSRQNALDRALADVPAGSTVTGQSCIEIDVSGTIRYRCTVYWQ